MSQKSLTDYINDNNTRYQEMVGKYLDNYYPYYPENDLVVFKKGMEPQMPLTKDQIKRNRFYIGSESIAGKNWGHETLEAAIEHATTKVNDTNGPSEVFIVQIVKVVKKAQAPVTVVDVE